MDWERSLSVQHSSKGILSSQPYTSPADASHVSTMWHGQSNYRVTETNDSLSMLRSIPMSEDGNLNHSVVMSPASSSAIYVNEESMSTEDSFSRVAGRFSLNSDTSDNDL